MDYRVMALGCESMFVCVCVCVDDGEVEQQYLFVKPTLPGHLSIGVAPHRVGPLPKRGGSLGCACALVGESQRSVYTITPTVDAHNLSNE